MLKKIIVRFFPSLGKYKRFLIALVNNALPVKETYSQHREDIFLWEFIAKYNLTDSVYVDIGANHPTDISNTYLLYRKGLKGIVIEPNNELIDLFRTFRRRDIPLAIGCGNSGTIAEFHISKTPVLSSFQSNRETNNYKSLFVPILPLDSVMENMNYTFISLLSIDVEGFNYEVLKGATQTIKRSLLICIEFDTEDDKEKFTELLGSDFELLKTFGCNLVYRNLQLIVN